MKQIIEPAVRMTTRYLASSDQIEANCVVEWAKSTGGREWRSASSIAHGAPLAVERARANVNSIMPAHVRRVHPDQVKGVLHG